MTKIVGLKYHYRPHGHFRMVGVCRRISQARKNGKPFFFFTVVYWMGRHEYALPKWAEHAGW